MKFEHLLWIVLFLFYLVSVLIKKKLAASKAGGIATPQKTSVWKEKLNQLLLQAVTGAERSGASQDRYPIQEAIVSERTEAVVKKPPVPKIKPPVPKAAAKRAEPADLEITLRPEDSAVGISDLRKAVIWSEILAPPLALREK